jgi:hypothetical protein
MLVNSSIDYSGLLITRTLHRYKHQQRDFFNTLFTPTIPPSAYLQLGMKAACNKSGESL